MTADLPPYPAYKDSGVPWLGLVPEQGEITPGLCRSAEAAVGCPDSQGA
jgi:hypothetical protein